jgi:hypothetical protein
MKNIHFIVFRLINRLLRDAILFYFILFIFIHFSLPDFCDCRALSTHMTLYHSILRDFGRKRLWHKLIEVNFLVCCWIENILAHFIQDFCIFLAATAATSAKWVKQKTDLSIDFTAKRETFLSIAVLFLALILVIKKAHEVSNDSEALFTFSIWRYYLYSKWMLIQSCSI